jgi:molybdopterin-containing oxidoreductase family iron-sulfur binding subunit
MATAELKVRIDADLKGYQAGLIKSVKDTDVAANQIEKSVGGVAKSFTVLNSTKFTFGQNYVTASQTLANQAQKTSQILGGSVAAGSNQAAFALTNLGRVAQDAPFGFIGIQNNLNPLLESFQRLKTETGSTSLAFKALGASLLGPAGIGIALSVVSSATLAATVFSSSAVAAAVAKISSAPKAGKIELQLYQKVAIGAGQGAANPWLQEMPDPVTRATWDNYLIVSPALARTLLKIDLRNGGQADDYEVNPPKKVVEIKANGKTIQLPALIIPGTDENTVGIAVGYGRDAKLGKAVVDENGELVGKNAFPFAGIVDGSVSFDIADVTVTLTDKKYPVALTQTHNIYNTEQGNRVEVMKELTLAQYKHNPKEVLEEREHELKPYGGLEKFKEDGSIYKPIDKPGVKWGMSIDLNACNGCGACVVACNAENNVSVVGKPEVLRFHDMHWLRIDRYYTGDLENPTVVFQPLMCQHCDNAPCENVCPVAATNHSSEGLNQMTYNRCIGTRYCANNCPYKVRRFNWADYTGSDSFKDNQGHLNDTIQYMNEDLTRMVLNPDVTVRSRGVIEKCSFCVQRLQEGKLKAKKESRPLETGGEGKQWDLKVACQQSCPTNAIVFGNANDSKSAVSVHRSTNNNRIFYSLEQLHVLPNVSYLAKVRNLEGEHKVADISKKDA